MTKVVLDACLIHERCFKGILSVDWSKENEAKTFKKGFPSGRPLIRSSSEDSCDKKPTVVSV